MSRETTMARAMARYWADQYRYHLAGCWRCSDAVKRRAWRRLCDRGAALRTDKQEAEQELAVNRELDKQPVPGQERLL